jgi:capsid protein
VYGYIDAPGFIDALREKNQMVMGAYLYNRWVGDLFPDIDPLKTVKYLREAMGVAFEHVPLMTPERAAEILEQGGIADIIKQSGEELKDTEAAGIKLPSASMKDPATAAEHKEGEVTKAQAVKKVSAITNKIEYSNNLAKKIKNDIS